MIISIADHAFCMCVLACRMYIYACAFRLLLVDNILLDATLFYSIVTSVMNELVTCTLPLYVVIINIMVLLAFKMIKLTFCYGSSEEVRERELFWWCLSRWKMKRKGSLPGNAAWRRKGKEILGFLVWHGGSQQENWCHILSTSLLWKFLMSDKDSFLYFFIFCFRLFSSRWTVSIQEWLVLWDVCTLKNLSADCEEY